MANADRHEFCRSYFYELVGRTRARYESKVEMCGGLDPYTLRVGTDSAPDAGLLPSTTHNDIISYLVLSTSYLSHQQMKAYKSLEAHNYFTSGRVKTVTAMRVPSKRVVVLSEVTHSQRLREAPLKVWVLAEPDGAIVTAHCTCMAGAGEACSHIGATLLAVETAVRLRDSRVCKDKKSMWLPAHSSGAGRPSGFMDDAKPNWTPTQPLGYGPAERPAVGMSARFARMKARQKKAAAKVIADAAVRQSSEDECTAEATPADDPPHDSCSLRLEPRAGRF
ncbi:uncharacterized protein LOC144095608 [Amblyomma americanum]